VKNKKSKVLASYDYFKVKEGKVQYHVLTNKGKSIFEDEHERDLFVDVIGH